jgi:NhaP-type Na+/H+ and K+/H+ antiporter
MKTLKLIFAILTLACSINCGTKKQASVSINDYKLETVEYNVKDSNIKDLLNTHMDKTKFKKGQSIKESTFIKERERIVKLIRKNQNPDFSEDRVSFEIDTTLMRNKFSVVTTIQN